MDALLTFIHHGGQGWLSPTEWQILALISSTAYSAMVTEYDRLPCSCSIYHTHLTEAFLCFINSWSRQDALLIEHKYGPASYLIPPRCYRIFPLYRRTVLLRDDFFMTVSSQSRQCCSYRHSQLQLAGFDAYNQNRMASNDLGAPTECVLTQVDHQIIRTGTCLNRDVPNRAQPPSNMRERSVVWCDPTPRPIQ